MHPGCTGLRSHILHFLNRKLPVFGRSKKCACAHLMVTAELREAPCRRYQRTIARRHPPTDRGNYSTKEAFRWKKGNEGASPDAIRGRGATAGGPSRDGWHPGNG